MSEPSRDNALPLDDLTDGQPQATGLPLLGRPDWRNVLFVSFVSALCAFLVSLAFLFVVQADNRNTIDRAADRAQSAAEAAGLEAQATSCNRTQVKNALERLTVREDKGVDARRTSAVDYFYPILDCQATYSPQMKGRTVRLPKELDGCFLELTDWNYWIGQRVFTDPGRLEAVCRDKGLL